MPFNKCDTQQRSFELKTKRAVVLLFEAILISKQQCLMGPHFMFCSGLMYLPSLQLPLTIIEQRNSIIVKLKQKKKQKEK